MDNEKSIAAAKFDDAEKAEQVSATSKGAVARRRFNIRMTQNILLIWLDGNIDDHNADCQNAVYRLRHVVQTVKPFKDSDECIEFIENITDAKVCMIVSGYLGQRIVPRVHNMSKVDSIFIFCGNRKRHEQWAKEWRKIKGVFTEISPICEAFKQAVRQRERDSISIHVKRGDLDRLDPSFMCTRMLKQMLLEIKHNETEIDELADYCHRIYSNIYSNNTGQLEIIAEFQRAYHDNTPVWWYTRECFTYHMINEALRTQNIETIIKMGFFLRDVHHQIEELQCQTQLHGSFVVYRGQGMANAEFETVKVKKGGLLTFNNFLSTSLEEEVSLWFARNSLDDPNQVGILFRMTIDTSIASIPFALVDDVSYYKKMEKEVLFSMHTVFRIGQSTEIEDRLWRVELQLTRDDDQIAAVQKYMGEYTEEIELYQQSLETYLESLPANHPHSAIICGNIGLVYHNMGKYLNAIKFYKRSLEIRQENNGSDDQNFALTYSCMGSVYQNMGDYSKALESYLKALEIEEKLLPSSHPNLAASYDTMGQIYNKMGEYSKALSFYERSLEIKRNSLPSYHPDLGITYNNIGQVYNEMGEYSKALAFYEKSLEIKQKSLPSDHPDTGITYNNIGQVYENMGEYQEALSSYKKSLKIKEKSLSPNHPDLGITYNNIGQVHNIMGEYSMALSFNEKSLEIKLKSLPFDHPDLGISYNNIGLVYSNMCDYSRALSYYEKALEIFQKILPPNHPDLAISYNNLGMLYDKMDEYSKARSFYERAVDIGQRSLPPNHPYLQRWRNSLDTVKKKL